MRILWLKSELLHPVDKGGRIRTYQMLKSLARNHHVIYLCLDDGKAAADAVARASEYCSELVAVPFKTAERLSGRFFLELLGNLFSGLPYSISRYRSSGQAAAAGRLASTVDLVICDFLTPSQNLPDGIEVPKVLFQHNVEAMIWQRHAAVAGNFLTRLYMREQWRRMLRFERVQCRRYDSVIAVSEADARVMRGEYGLRSVSSVRTGVDLDYFRAPTSRPIDNRELIFVGSMDWMPNEDGIRWFASEVFGLVRARVPGTTLTIVGRSPSAALRRALSPFDGISLTGSVDDVRPYLARGAVSVVPLRVGGGTRLKIYEAMAMGIPVVSTTIGAEGLPVTDGNELLIADTPTAQADAIERLLTDPGQAEQLAARATEFVRRYGSWDAVTEQFLDQCIPMRGIRASSHEDICA